MRKNIESPLAGATLTDSSLSGISYDPQAMMPDVKVLKVGGQSIMDRGRSALFPILDELVAAKDNYKLLICCGGGTRARQGSSTWTWQVAQVMAPPQSAAMPSRLAFTAACIRLMPGLAVTSYCSKLPPTGAVTKCTVIVISC